MKLHHRFVFVAVLICAIASRLSAAEDPHAVLEAIKKLRADRLAEAKAAEKRPDLAAIAAEALAKARDGVKDVDAAKVDLSHAAAWTDLFSQAQDYKGAQTVAGRWAAQAKGEEKFKAQMALITASSRLKDMRGVAKTIGEATPANAAGGIQLANLANAQVLTALTDADRETALKILAAGEAAVPKEGFADDKQKDQAKAAAGNLAKTRKAIADNPGKEAEAVQAVRRASFAQAFANRTGGNTNAAAAAAARNQERDAKLAKFVGKDAADFKPTHTIGDFKNLADLKGKVVVLDFFAHWCGPCIASLPSMRELNDELKSKGLRMVGVTRFYGYYKKEHSSKKDMSAETELARMKDFIGEKKINWPVAFVGKEVFEAYGCSAIPHVVVIDKQGKVHKIKVGYDKAGVEAFHKEIEKLLAA